MDEIFGSVVLEHIGVYTKWMIQFFINKSRGRRVLSVKEILHGKKGLKEYDLIMQGWSNIWVGVLVILLFAILLMLIDFK